jgi:tetratricopeptide (TPR) repeat protein
MRSSTRPHRRFLGLLLGASLLAGCAGPGVPGDGARIYEAFGNYRRPVGTDSPEAQRWFDQGMQLLYGFNHDEAIRSFRQAAAADPQCAMAWWGVSYASGLHINNPEMTEEQSRQGWEAAREAMRRLERASPVEAALIRAVTKRYIWPAPEDRRPLDEEYAEAMGEVWKAHPDDPDAGALYAEALMNLQPWDLWTHDGQPKGRTEEIVAVLEAVLAMAPDHPGANHFYIHAVEASPSPERATAAAERLGSLVPGSGHLVHMPSHIFIRTGRYAEAAEANARAIAADERYFAVAPPPRFYRIYFIHNLHFLAYASMMEGRYETALGAARRIEAEVPEKFLREHVKLADSFLATTPHVLIRFGKWDEVLRRPEPPEHRLVSRVAHHYACSVALSALGRTEEARAELARFDELAAQVGDDWLVGNNPATAVLPIARRMAAGELAYREGRRDEAFALLREAVRLEEELVYDEPPGWMQPVRHALGALLLGAGRAGEAEAVYREDLERHPRNAWSLLGLRQALLAQGKAAEAQALAPSLEAAWARADVRPTSSCYCQPAG